MTCPNCGTQNDDGSRFCAECGADLRSLGSQRAEPTPSFGASQPPVYGQPETGGWSATTTPDLEPEKKRRGWLWVLLGILGACLICCCVATIWASTSGEDQVNEWLTRLSEELTEVAPSPTPRR